VKIAVSDLSAVSQKLLAHLEHLGVREVEIEVDYYWRVPPEQLYDTARSTVEPDLGQLSDDWEKLRMIQRGERQPVAAALEWLGATLRAVGERVAG
jgi:hypothetical protein